MLPLQLIDSFLLEYNVGQALAPIHYLFLGIVLLVVGPVLWVTADR